MYNVLYVKKNMVHSPYIELRWWMFAAKSRTFTYSWSSQSELCRGLCYLGEQVVGYKGGHVLDAQLLLLLLVFPALHPGPARWGLRSANAQGIVDHHATTTYSIYHTWWIQLQNFQAWTLAHSTPDLPIKRTRGESTGCSAIFLQFMAWPVCGVTWQKLLPPA